MSSSKASSSDPVALEKGVTGLKEEELSDPGKSKSMRIKLLLLDAVALLYVLFGVGFVAWAIAVSNTWLEPLPAIFMMLLIVVGTLWLTTMVKEACIQNQGHETEEEEGTLGSGGDDSDLSTKLLVAPSNKKLG